MNYKYNEIKRYDNLYKINKIILPYLYIILYNFI